jgi:5'-3' exonuclease
MGVDDNNKTLKTMALGTSQILQKDDYILMVNEISKILQTNNYNLMTNEICQILQRNNYNYNFITPEFYEMLKINNFNFMANNIYQIIQNSNCGVINFIFHTGIPLNTFRGFKIAFDVANIMYAKMTTAHNIMVANSINVLDDFDRDHLVSESMKAVLGFFALIFKAGITPVCVFDGKLHPYKEEEIRKRGNVKKAKSDKIEKATIDYLNVLPLDRTPEMDAALRHELRNHIKITKEDYKTMQTMLESIGICCINAPFDGEQVCSRLNREGIVQAVYSTDTDNYAHGASIMISEIYYSGHETVCNIVRMDELLYCFQTYCGNPNYGLTQFIDLCIMHGCDYNSRTQVPTKSGTSYKSCGPKGAIDCIIAFGNFENFTQNYWPCFEPLNINKCREMFYYQPTKIVESDTDLDWVKFRNNLNNTLDFYKLDGYLRHYFTSVSVDPFKIKKDQTQKVEQQYKVINSTNLNILSSEITFEHNRQIATSLANSF